MFGERLQDLLQQTAEPESDEPPRELTVEEALQIAIDLQRLDRCEEANAVFGEILKVDPENPRALHFAGVLAHQTGRSRDGIGLIEKSLALVPDVADWHNNFGIVLQETGDLDRAIGAYHRAIALDPNHANAHSNLGVLLRATGKPEDAEAAYRTAIRLNPEHIDAHSNLGILLYGLKRQEEAVACFCRVITLRPKHPEARQAAGVGALQAGRIRQSESNLRRMAHGGSRQSCRQAHAFGVHRAQRSRTRVGWLRAHLVRQLCGELRVEARETLVPCPDAGWRDARRQRHRGVPNPRRPRHGLWHGVVWSPDSEVRAPAGRDRSVGGHAERTLRRSRCTTTCSKSS